MKELINVFNNCEIDIDVNIEYSPMFRTGTSSCARRAATPPTPRPPTSAPTGSTSGGRAVGAGQTAGAGAGGTATTGSCTWGRGAPGLRCTPTCSAHTGECTACITSVAVEVHTL